MVCPKFESESSKFFVYSRLGSRNFITKSFQVFRVKYLVINGISVFSLQLVQVFQCFAFRYPPGRTRTAPQPNSGLCHAGLRAAGVGRRGRDRDLNFDHSLDFAFRTRTQSRNHQYFLTKNFIIYSKRII